MAATSLAEARRRTASLGATSLPRRSRKSSSSSTRTSSRTCEWGTTRLGRELASCDLPSSMQPRAYRPDRNLERKRDLFVAEVRERIEKQRIPFPRAHLRKSTLQPCAESQPINPCEHLLVVCDPAVDAAAAVCPQPPSFAPPALTDEVRRDPVQPRENAATRAAARTPLERE